MFYGIYEVVSVHSRFGVVVERVLRPAYGAFTSEAAAQRLAKSLGERYAIDQVTVTD
jgi:hypothetical protein